MAVLLITGSNGGIGSAVCELFKKNNWIVIGIDIHDKCQNKFTSTYFKIDITQSNQIQELFKNIDKVDCLINCAAYQCCKPIWEYTEDEWVRGYRK